MSEWRFFQSVHDYAEHLVSLEEIELIFSSISEAWFDPVNCELERNNHCKKPHS